MCIKLYNKMCLYYVKMVILEYKGTGKDLVEFENSR